MQYKLLSGTQDVVRAVDDNGVVKFIPNDPANRDWQIYQAWLSNGNTPEPADEE